MSILLHVGVVTCRECERYYLVAQNALTSLKCCPFCRAERTFTEEDVEEARRFADPDVGPGGWVN